MKVDELHTELMARDLDTRGLKGRLIVRLREALDAEKVLFPKILKMRRDFCSAQAGTFVLPFIPRPLLSVSVIF